MGSTILHMLRKSEARLAAVDSPRLSAEIIMTEVLGGTRLDLVMNRDQIVSDADADTISRLVERRATGEPLAYILGRQEFYGRDFLVSPATLIPRPETEHLIEEVQGRFDKEAPFHFVDLGTGSGILAVMIAFLFPNCSGEAVDKSKDALKVAESNAEKHGVRQRISFHKADFTQPFFPRDQFDLILSNPPYVTRKDYDNASREVTGFEPRSALISGDDGLDHIRAMLPHVAHALKSGGLFLMEIGYQQGDSIKKIIREMVPEFGKVEVKKDLSRHDRIVVVQKL